MNTLDQPHPLISAAVPLDLPATRAALDVVARRLVEAGGGPRPQAPTRGLAWTLGETRPARRRRAGAVRRLRPRPGPAGTGHRPGRSPGSAWTTTRSEHPACWPGNWRPTPAATWPRPPSWPPPIRSPSLAGSPSSWPPQAILLGEFVVHGDDVARSIGRPLADRPRPRPPDHGGSHRRAAPLCRPGRRGRAQRHLPGPPAWRPQLPGPLRPRHATVGLEPGSGGLPAHRRPGHLPAGGVWRRSQWPRSSASCAPGPPTLARPAVPGPVRAA